MSIDSSSELSIPVQETSDNSETSHLSANKPRPLFRRSRLGLKIATIGALGVIALTGCHSGATADQQQQQGQNVIPISMPVQQTEASTASETTLSQDYAQEIGMEDSKIVLTFDGQERLPKKATFIKTGKTIYFDLEEVKEAQEMAMKGEYECLGVFIEETLVKNENDEDYVSTKEHPKIEELPDDVVPEEKLREYGVNIIQVNRDENSPVLHIRDGAFKEGGILEGQTSKKPLNIVIIDGIALVQNYIMQDQNPELQQILSSLPIDPYFRSDGFVNNKLSEIRQQILATKSHILAEGTEAGSLQILMAELAQEKAFQDGMLSENQLLDLYLSEVMFNQDKRQLLVNLYGNNIFTRMGEYHSDENTIFLLAGRGSHAINQYGLFFDKDGNIQIGYGGNYAAPADLQYSVPSPGQTYSDPGLFPRASDNPEGYVVGAQVGNPAYNLEHEVAHIGEGRNETSTDQKALNQLEEAWRKWKDSGDNTGYPFVFSIPGGGYLVSDNNGVLNSGQQNS